MTENYDRARNLLSTHKEELVCIAEELLIREVLDAEQVRRLAKGLPIEDPLPDPAPGSTPPTGSVSTSDESEPASLVPPVPSFDKAVPQE